MATQSKYREMGYDEEIIEKLESISQVIRETREAKGLTQNELADMAGTCQSHIRRIERGEIIPQLDTIIKIADALGLDLSLKKAKPKWQRMFQPCVLMTIDDPEIMPKIDYEKLFSYAKERAETGVDIAGAIVSSYVTTFLKEDKEKEE